MSIQRLASFGSVTGVNIPHNLMQMQTWITPTIQSLLVLKPKISAFTGLTTPKFPITIVQSQRQITTISALTGNSDPHQEVRTQDSSISLNQMAGLLHTIRAHIILKTKRWKTLPTTESLPSTYSPSSLRMGKLSRKKLVFSSHISRKFQLLNFRINPFSSIWPWCILPKMMKNATRTFPKALLQGKVWNGEKMPREIVGSIVPKTESVLHRKKQTSVNVISTVIAQ